MKRKNVIIGPGQKNNILNNMFLDVINGKVEDTVFLSPYNFNSRIIRKIYDYIWRDVNRKFFRWLPVSIWNRFSVLNSINPNEDEEYYILFVIGRDVERLIVPSLIKKIKHRYKDKVRTVLVLFDSINVTKECKGWDHITDFFELFDKVATFDKLDAEKYKLIHFFDPYPKCEIAQKVEEQVDLFFLGEDKGRAHLLCQIADIANRRQVKCDFRIFNWSGNSPCPSGVCSMDKFIEYKDTLKLISRSRCLVDIIAEGQNSSSLRYYEAVVYNKKLLTNNLNIMNMPLYNPKYMKCFRRIEDIDWEWIDEREVVDYGYENEFSVNVFLNTLCNGKQYVED